MITYVATTPEHVRYIAAHMREADKQEVWLATGCPPGLVLPRAVGISREVWTAVVDGVPAAIYGYSLTPTGEGIPWMLGTDEVPRHQRALVARGREIVRYIDTQCRCQVNLVHAENTRAIRWLKALGYSLEAPVKHGPFEALFIPFYRHPHNV